MLNDGHVVMSIVFKRFTEHVSLNEHEKKKTGNGTKNRRLATGKTLQGFSGRSHPEEMQNFCVGEPVLLHNIAVSITKMRCFAPRIKSGSKGF